MVDLKRLAFDKNLNQSALGEIFGLPQPEVSKLMNGRRDIKQEHIDLLTAHFGEECVKKYMVSDEVVSMFHTPQAKQIDATIVPAEVVEEIKEEVLAETQPPFVPLHVARHPNLDVMEWLKKGNGRHVSSTFNIMAILSDTTFYTEVRSNAMSPALNQGEILFLKEFEKGFVFVDGLPYVIDTYSRGMLAFYLYDRGDYIEARPHNARFETLNIAKSDIIRYYQILFHGSTWVATSLPTGECSQQVERQAAQISELITQNGKTLQIIEELIKK